jgi:hypothetical protein
MMNQVLHYTEMMGFDATSALAEALKSSLSSGALVSHPMMMVLSAKAGLQIKDPVTQRSTQFVDDGIYARMRDGNLMTQGLGEWGMIAGLNDLEAVSVYLAEHTPVSERFPLMCHLIESLPKSAREREKSSEMTF